MLAVAIAALPSCLYRKPYLSGSAEGEVLPTEVSDDPGRQGVAQDVDHGPKPVAMETKGMKKLRRRGSEQNGLKTRTGLCSLQDPVYGYNQCYVIWREAH